MPHNTIKLKPGVEVTTTLALNEANYSKSNLIRFLPERMGLGVAQKMGGWVAYYNSFINSTIRSLKGWSDLNAINHLGIGATNQLAVLTNNNLQTITPYVYTDNISPSFTTTAGSAVVTVSDSNITVNNLDYVEFVTPVSVDGIILSGPYLTTYVSGTTYTVTAASTGLAGVTGGGAVYKFTTANGSQVVSCLFNNHGYSVGTNFYVGVPLTIGGITLSGLYTVLSVTDVNNFTFNSGQQASSTSSATFINSGNVRVNYYTTALPQLTGTGYGVGGYGVGGYGLGVATTIPAGSPISGIEDWTLDNFGQYLVACPSNSGFGSYSSGGPLYYWQPNGSFLNAQLLSSQAPLVNDGFFIAMPQRQVVAWGSSFTLQQDPLLIRWCDLGDFTVWNASSTNQAGSFRIPTGSKIVTCIQGPQQGLIWTDIDLYAMQYVGYPLVYGFNKIGSNCGAISRKCVGQINNQIYWMSQNQFYQNTGSGPQPLPCPIWDVIYGNLNTGSDANGVPYTSHIRTAVNSQFNEVMWFYPSSASTTGENDSYVKYNIALQQWDYGSLGRSAWIDQSVLGNPIGAGIETINGQTQNWIYQHEVGNDAAVGLQTTAMLSSFQTGYFQLNEADNLIFLDLIWPDMKWGTYSGTNNATVQITFYATNYPGDTPIQYGPYSVTQATENLSVRIRSRLLSIAMSSNDVGTFWRLGAMRYRYQLDGRF